MNNNTSTILVAEDDDMSFELLEYVLLSENVQVIRVTDGKEAIDQCRSNDTIRLVLMDIKMPDLDGISATREIRKFKPDLIIIAQTAHVYELEKKQAFDAGCNYYLEKPIDIKLLLSMIRSL